MITEKAVRAWLTDHIAKKYVTKKAAAVHWGVSQSFVSQVVGGTKRPPLYMLAELNLREVRAYVRENDVKELAE